METSSPRFKSLAVTAGLSFWFFIITSSTGLFSVELLIAFFASILIITQIFAKKISKGLDIFAIINTKIFLGILFVAVISVYGILFRLLQIDLLRDSMKNLETHCTKTVDLRNTFDGIDQPIFFDQGHVGPLGNKIIAKKLFDISLPIIKNKII